MIILDYLTFISFMEIPWSKYIASDDFSVGSAYDNEQSRVMAIEVQIKASHSSSGDPSATLTLNSKFWVELVMFSGINQAEKPTLLGVVVRNVYWEHRQRSKHASSMQSGSNSINNYVDIPVWQGSSGSKRPSFNHGSYMSSSALDLPSGLQRSIFLMNWKNLYFSLIVKFTSGISTKYLQLPAEKFRTCAEAWNKPCILVKEKFLRTIFVPILKATLPSFEKV